MFFKNIAIVSAFIFALLWYSSIMPAYSEDMTDFDYNFIDNAFANPKPATNKQFEEVMQRFEAEPNGLIYKFKRFLNRNNPEFDKNFKKQFEATGKQPLRIKDEPTSKPTVTIGGNFYDTHGKELPGGHYQVDYRKDGEQYIISLFQGQTRTADFKANLYEDDWETPAVVYSRLQNIKDNLVQIIYSNLDLTISSYIRLK